MLRMLASLALTIGPPGPDGPPAPPAVVVRFQSPDLQLQRLISLFEGSRSSSPAAALAAWKNATQGKQSLSKAAEAGIAALNSRMVPELRTLESSELLIDFSPTDGNLAWSFCIPHDDGTISAFATATALTDGQSEPPLGPATVDRLGPEGSAYMARSDEAVVLGGTRVDLARGLAWILEARPGTVRETTPAIVSQINSQSLATSSSLIVRRIGLALAGLEILQARNTLAIEDHRLQGRIEWNPGAVPRSLDCALNPEWSARLPGSASAAFSMAIDPQAANWDRIFTILDQIEKADPQRAKLSPLRVRLNLLATAARLNPERDLWPKLRGVSGFLLGTVESPRGAAMALHTTDEASAAVLREKFLPGLARTLRLPPIGVEISGGLPLGMVSGRPLSIVPDTGTQVWIVWGEDAFTGLLQTRSDPSLSIVARGADREHLRDLSRVAWVWPQRISHFPEASPLLEALKPSPPIVWEGRSRGVEQWDRVSSGDLRPLIRRYLEVIPQEPARDPGRE